jgi:hypothetical protein
MKIYRNLDVLHPVLIQCIKKIQSSIIDTYNVPMRLFETGRDHERHEMLINKGKTKDIFSNHLHNLENDPPLYATAVDYVYFDQKWSWNLRDSTIMSWYILFGNMVLDICPEIYWSGYDRKRINYCHFQLRYDIVLNNMEEFPCVMPLK